MNHEDVICCIAQIACTADIVLPKKRFCLTRVADKVNMNIQLLGCSGKSLNDLCLNVIFIRSRGCDIQRHQVIDDNHISSFFLYPFKDHSCDCLPVVAVIVVVDRKRSSQYLVQVLLYSFFQPVVPGRKLIRFNLIPSCSLQIQPVLHDFRRHFA